MAFGEKTILKKILLTKRSEVGHKNTTACLMLSIDLMKLYWSFFHNLYVCSSFTTFVRC